MPFCVTTNPYDGLQSRHEERTIMQNSNTREITTVDIATAGGEPLTGSGFENQQSESYFITEADQEAEEQTR